MAIIINLDVMLAKRKMRLNELSERVGITQSNLSILKQGKAKAIKISTLNTICDILDCQPGDILEYNRDKVSESPPPWQIQVKENKTFPGQPLKSNEMLTRTKKVNCLSLFLHSLLHRREIRNGLKLSFAPLRTGRMASSGNAYSLNRGAVRFNN